MSLDLEAEDVSPRPLHLGLAELALRRLRRGGVLLVRLLGVAAEVLVPVESLVENYECMSGVLASIVYLCSSLGFKSSSSCH